MKRMMFRNEKQIDLVSSSLGSLHGNYYALHESITASSQQNHYRNSFSHMAFLHSSYLVLA
jgi:hypothetical protein